MTMGLLPDHQVVLDRRNQDRSLLILPLLLHLMHHLQAVLDAAVSMFFALQHSVDLYQYCKRKPASNGPCTVACPAKGNLSGHGEPV